MKVLLCLSALIAAAVAENCTALADCSVTTCDVDGGYEKHCIDHYCVCTHVTAPATACTSDSDCTDPTPCHGRHHIGPVFFEMKCLRSECHCTATYHHSGGHIGLPLDHLLGGHQPVANP